MCHYFTSTTFSSCKSYADEQVEDDAICFAQEKEALILKHYCNIINIALLIYLVDQFKFLFNRLSLEIGCIELTEWITRYFAICFDHFIP